MLVRKGEQGPSVHKEVVSIGRLATPGGGAGGGGTPGEVDGGSGEGGRCLPGQVGPGVGAGDARGGPVGGGVGWPSPVHGHLLRAAPEAVVGPPAAHLAHQLTVGLVGRHEVVSRPFDHLVQPGEVSL